MRNFTLKTLFLSVLLCVSSWAGAETKWVKTDITNLESNDVIVIVDQTSSRALSNNNGASNAPAATEVTLNGDKSEITSAVGNTLQWVVTVTESNGTKSYKFKVPSASNYLYCTNTNNGVRVGTNTNNAFKWATTSEGSYLKETSNSRFVGVYNDQDWRCYTGTSGNIKSTVTAFYKKVEEASSPLASIALSGTYPTTFTKGEEFSHEGMTVTATYEDNSTKDVTANATFSGYNMSTTGEQTVTVSYTEGGVTKTATYDITVIYITSIALSGEYPTEFTEGDEFSHEGMIVTATYSNESTKDVTASASFSGYDMNIPGTQEVTVTVGEETETYNIVVNEKPSHNVTWSVNGETTVESYKEGETIAPIANPVIDGYEFKGWVTEEIFVATTTKPSYTTPKTMGNADVTYYAVFAISGGDADITDVLENETIGVSGTNYSDWSNKKATSDAVYAGNSAGGNASIQLRSNNSNSGIVSMTSGGKLKKVVIKWNSNTAKDRKIDIYGKNTAYTAATDLYDTNEQGTKIGTIVCGTSTELTITDDYDYFGLRSNSGAMYLDKISITWAAEGVEYCTTIDTSGKTSPTLSFEESNISITYGESVSNALTNENSVPVTYTSTNTEVATVNSETGAVTVLKAGETIIKATSKETDTYKAGEVSYTLTVAKADPALAFSEETATAYLGKSFTEPTLTNEKNVAVTYESSNPSAATVDEEGIITLVAEGEATITASFEEDDCFIASSASYTLTVKDPFITKSTLVFTEACDGNGTADDDAEWTVESDADESNFDSTRGIHYGTSTKSIQYLQLATSGINGRITKVVVNATDVVGIGTITVTVGDAEFTGETTTVGTVQSDYTFTGSGNGEIVVRIDRGEAQVKAIYVKSVIVTYEPAYTRTINRGEDATKFGSICLPFGVDTFEGATFYEISGKKDNAVVLNQVSSLVAGVGYIFEATADEISLIPNGTKVDEPVTTGAIIGTFEDETAVADGMYIVSNNELRKTSGGFGMLNANRAYIDLSKVETVAEAKGRVIYFDGESTGIETVEAETAGEATYFSMDGREVKAPQKGIYLMKKNGRTVKVMIQ